MLYIHISKVPYSKRQDFAVSQKGPNRYHLEVTQGGQFICLTFGSVYGGYHQGYWEKHYACSSERAAKRIFNQMKVFGYNRALDYLYSQNVKSIPQHIDEDNPEHLKLVGILK